MQAWSAWRSLVDDRQHLVEGMLKAAHLFTGSKLASAFYTWSQNVRDAIRERYCAGAVLAHLRNRGLSCAFRAWVQYTDSAVQDRADLALAESHDSWRRGLAALREWAGNAGEAVRTRQLVQTVVNHWTQRYVRLLLLVLLLATALLYAASNSAVVCLRGCPFSRDLACAVMDRIPPGPMLSVPVSHSLV